MNLNDREPVLLVQHLDAGYGTRHVLREIDLAVCPGEILGIAGESGCGKSTLIRSILWQTETGIRHFSGHVLFQGKDLPKLENEELRKLRGVQLGIISQNPGGSFNPIRTYKSQFIDTLKSHGLYRPGESEERISAIFRKLHLDDPERILNSCPYALSGGMNQRVAIALMMLLSPPFVLADEPTSALDVTVQKQVADEFLAMRKEMGTSIVLVTHNIGLLRYLADRIAILYAGSIVESGSREQVLHNPVHPYTKALVHAVPTLGGPAPEGLEGVPPKHGAEMAYCPFYDRCPEHMEVCRTKRPGYYELETGHKVSCWLWES